MAQFLSPASRARIFYGTRSPGLRPGLLSIAAPQLVEWNIHDDVDVSITEPDHKHALNGSIP
jgi:hypothetical protein